MSALAQVFASSGHDWIVADTGCNVRAFVTTRNGGACSGERATMDMGPARLGSLDAATRACVEENRRRVEAFLPGAPVWLEQVHGTAVATVDETTVAAFRATPPVADAAVTRVPNVPLAIRIADCLPVVLADEAGSTVAIAHAGWRGLAGGVIEAAIDAMNIRPAALQAWLGPCIGPRAFEVGPDVVGAFTEVHPGDASAFRPHRAGKWLADLAALAGARLSRAGVIRVGGSLACTHENDVRFFSYRRDRTPARFAAFAWLDASR